MVTCTAMASSSFMVSNPLPQGVGGLFDVFRSLP